MKTLPGGQHPSINSAFPHRHVVPETPEPVGPRHRKGGKLRYKNREVLGRLFWDAAHASPWVVFKNETAFKRWSTDVRKARPGTKTEMMYFGWHTPESLLSSARGKN